MAKKKKEKLVNIIVYILSGLFSVVFIVPLYYSFVYSLNSLYSVPTVIPKHFEYINYYYAVTLIPFMQYLKNSIKIVGTALGLSFVFNFMYGYAFARLPAKASKPLFYLTLTQMMIPSFAIMIPQYIFFSNMGIKDTLWIWVLSGVAGTPFIIFMYRQYLYKIPKEIEEAAIIDGCNYFNIIYHVYLPLCKPIIAVAMFYDFVAHWGDFMTPFMYLTEKNYPLSIALFGMRYVLPQNPGVQMGPVVNAASLILALPVLVVFFLCQKQLVEGVTSGSVKG